MIQKLMPEAKQGWALMLSWHRTGGFRQIATRDGQLIFTRLTPPLAPDTSPAYLGSHLATDLHASLDYLGRLGLTDKSALRFVAILPHAMHATLTALHLPMRAQKTLTPFEAAKILRLPFAPAEDDPTADLLHAAWLVRQKRPRAPLPAPNQRRAFKPVFLVLLVAALALSGTLGWNFINPPPLPAPPALHPVEKQKPAPSQTAAPPEPLHLDAILYTNPADWTVWLQGAPWTPDTNRPDLHIIAVTPDSVKLSRTTPTDSQEITLRPHQTYNPATGQISETPMATLPNTPPAAGLPPSEP